MRASHPSVSPHCSVIMMGVVFGDDDVRHAQRDITTYEQPRINRAPYNTSQSNIFIAVGVIR